MSDNESYSSVIDDDYEYDSPLLGSRLPHANNYYSNGNVTSIASPPVVILEPPNSYRSRWRSIRIMYLTMFLSAVTFTITISSLWPFLQELDPSVTPSFLGWVVAAYSLGQLVASPFFGTWANCRRSSREPLTVSLLLTVLFNVLYMYLQSIPDRPHIYMAMARGLVGFSAGNVAVVRSYISGATTMKERTTCMANVSIFQALGFILGPVIQSCLVPLHFPGPVESSSLHINMYTAPALFACILAFINLVLVIFVFKEHKVDGLEEAGVASQIQKGDDEEQAANGGGTNGHAHAINGEATSLLDSDEESKPDLVAILSSIFLFFVILFMFTVFETIGTPLTMHMYAWTKTQATLYQGIILGCSAVTSIFVFVVVKMLAKKINERYLLLAGLVICLTAFFLFIPWGPNLPPLAFAPEKNASTTTSPRLFSMNDNRLVSKDGITEDTHIFLPSGNDHNQLAFEEPSWSQRSNDFSLAAQKRSSALTKGQSLSHELSGFSSSHHITDSVLLSSQEDKTAIQQGQMAMHDRELEVRNRFIRQFSAFSKSEEQETAGEGKHENSEDAKLEKAVSSELTFRGVNNHKQQNFVSEVNYFSTFSAPAESTASRTTIAPSSSSSLIATSTASSPYLGNTSTSTSQPPDSAPANNRTVDPEGCPWQYEWCRHVPALPLFQYLAATLVFSIGYPSCQMLSYTIYSKILGSQPQGVWMGWFTAAGSLARTVGPIYVSQIYDMSGPQATFASVAGLILLTTIFYLIVFRRLVPCKQKSQQDSGSPDRRTSA